MISTKSTLRILNWKMCEKTNKLCLHSCYGKFYYKNRIWNDDICLLGYDEYSKILTIDMETMMDMFLADPSLDSLSIVLDAITDKSYKMIVFEFENARFELDGESKRHLACTYVLLVMNYINSLTEFKLSKLTCGHKLYTLLL